jgi:predicted HAD superfamily hydrolase
MKEINLFTFDVFDTVITRSTALPAGIFDIMQEKLAQVDYHDIPAYIRDHFGLLRKNAEKPASGRKKILSSTGEVCLRDIYSCLANAAALTEEQTDRLIELEKESEYSCSAGIDENIEFIRNLRAAGKRVAFVSDMYLDSAFIRSLICKHAPDFADIPIYVSCEYGVGKASGYLFEKVLEAECVKADETEHFGDNADSDIAGSKKAGISNRLYSFEQLTNWEERIPETNSSAIVQMAIGTARNVRLNHKLSLSGTMGASYTAPALFPYVRYVLEKCIELDIKSLIFIARDGAVLKEIADAILCSDDKGKFTGVRTKLIYTSRTVLYADDQEKKDITTEYLLQELRKNGVISKFAFVDLQGTGKSMNRIAMMIKAYTNGLFDAFYMSSEALVADKGCNIHLFLAYQTDFSELLCRMPCGRTIGYTRESGNIIPVFDSHHGLFDGFDYDEYKEGIICFCRAFNRVCDSVDIKAASLMLCDAYLRYAVTAQCNEIMKFFGQMKFAFDEEKNDIRPYAVRPSKKELRDMYLLRDKEFRAFVYCSSVKAKYVSLMYTPEDQRKIAFYEKHYSGRIGKIAGLICRKPVIKNIDYHTEQLLKRLKKGKIKRLIIYGFGEVGRRVNSITQKSGFEVLLVVDKNHSKLEGVSDPQAITRMSYDAVVIAISNANACAEAKDYITALGVASEKIIIY